MGRRQALGLSVVANARDQTCGIASQLTVDRMRGDTVIDPGTILTQPDPDQSWPATIGETVDDLMFYGECYWIVLRRDSQGYPSRARRVPWSAVYRRMDPDYLRFSRVIEYQIGGAKIPPNDVIWFKTLGRGILREGATILLEALALQAAVQKFQTVALPAGVLTNEGQEVGETDAKKIVADFDKAREDGSTAFLQSMKYERTALNSADLQLVEACAVMDTRLARLCNVPVSVVGASPTGQAHAQLYANVVGNFTQLVQQTIAPYLRVIEETFTTSAVTPGGQRVAFDTADWLRFAQVAAPTPGLVEPPSPQGAPQGGADSGSNGANGGVA